MTNIGLDTARWMGRGNVCGWPVSGRLRGRRKVNEGGKVRKEETLNISSSIKTTHWNGNSENY